MQLEHTSKTRKYGTKFLLAAFLTAIALRLTPELMAYPYPLGYDVINYYIPVITNFGAWTMDSGFRTISIVCIVTAIHNCRN